MTVSQGESPEPTRADAGPGDRDRPAAFPARRGRDYAPLARRILGALAVACLLALAAFWAWHQPFMAYPRAVAALSRLPPPRWTRVPVEGVRARAIADTWGAPRGRDRRHQGVDIFAPRGTPVVSATRGLVVSIRDGGLGGRQVWVMGPAGERHYYAHLDAWEPDLAVGDLVREGTRLGRVGTSGNARGTPPHLHYGVYTGEGAIDPLPRLQATPPR
ncbi:M23 family metallopeptidase [Lysobacter xanthus]